MASSGSAVAGTTQAVTSACTGGTAWPLPSRMRRGSGRALAAATPAVGEGDQALRGQVEGGRVDDLRLGWAAPSHGDDDRRPPTALEDAGEVGGDGSLSGALSGADDGDRRFRRHVGARRRVEAEV